MKKFFKTKHFLLFIVLICVSALLVLACTSPVDNPKVNPPDPPIVDPPIVDPPIIVDPIDFDPGITWDGSGNTLDFEKVFAVDGAVTYEIARARSRWNDAEWVDAGTASAGDKWKDSDANPEKYENYYRIYALDGSGTRISTRYVSLETQLFGPTVLIFSPYDNMTTVQAEIMRIHQQEMFGSVAQGDGRQGEFSSRRYAFLFKPGTYTSTTYSIGFYTQVAGLGRLPADTELRVTINAPAHLGGDNATCTFWRSIENLHIGSNGSSNTFRWSVSQSAPVRRMLVDVSTVYDQNNGYCSGGFTADSYFRGSVGSYSQQQWYTRNCYVPSGIFGVNWNKTIQGCTGSPSAATSAATTIVAETPVIREKPFIFIDTDGEYKVFVPALREDAVGVSWHDGTYGNDNYAGENGGMGPGEILDLFEDFYIARAKLEQIGSAWSATSVDSAGTINAALAQGKHIFMAPGRMDCNVPIVIDKPNTIFLGYGFPTLYPRNKSGALFVANVSNVTVAGFIIDSTSSNSAYLLCAGDTNASQDHFAEPTFFFDMVLRTGGYFEETTHADVSALINSNNVVGDQFWVWRSDHGVSAGIAWEKNTSKNGVVVLGDDVTFYGLFVEHHHEYVTLWMGDRGRMYFYQNESPYDVTRQDQYNRREGALGWAMYKVANQVNEHLAVGLGMYPCFTRPGETIVFDSAMQVPHKEGVEVINACTVNLSAARGRATHVINGAGATSTSASPARVLSFKNGVASGFSGGSNGNGEAVEEPNETFWVEGLAINNNGLVTANLDGGLPPFAE